MSSKIKVDNIADQGNNNLINKCGSTITLGANGDTIQLASGASQSGFGRTGTVDWQTSIKTAASFTAVNGEGYFVDTSSNAITVNLPAGTAGSIVAFRDYASNFDTNSLTIVANGSQKIENSTENFNVIGENESLTLVYADDTKGWLVVNDGNKDAGASTAFISATGGTITTVCTNFKVHTFTGPGTFTVCSVGTGSNNVVDYLVLAGGGSGGGGDTGCISSGGGGGAGGIRVSNGTSSGSYCAGPSPLAGPVSALTVSAQGYPITVGAGGSVSGRNGCQQGAPGSNTTFSTITSNGGGGAGSGGDPHGLNGGSGGGGAQPGGSGGNGNTPPITPPQGNNGGTAANCQPAGGGGGGAVGANSPAPKNAGAGGAGFASSITGSPVARAGGGGGGSSGPSALAPSTNAGAGGTGGGGNGQLSACSPTPGAAGTANTGGGGGGGGDVGTNGGAANGGSGVVIIRYRFQ